MPYSHDADESYVRAVLAAFDAAEKADLDAISRLHVDENGVYAVATPLEFPGRRELEKLARRLFAACRCRRHVEAVKAGLLQAIYSRQPSPQILPGDEIARHEQAFARWNYRGVELDRLRQLLAVNEFITGIEPRSVATDRRTIERSALRPLRMAWETASAHEKLLARSVPSESELTDLDRKYADEQATIERARKEHQRSLERAEIAEQQLAASRQRAVEAQEDAIAALVRRSNARNDVH